ncbi:MotE family protein [Maridesulfovibrio sp. FT414]|uniref:MotE family protein n=1 Tax=Maridesulfovibrio sp. FT414 TaxID=2979469 RepID=UPI003D808332
MEKAAQAVVDSSVVRNVVETPKAIAAEPKAAGATDAPAAREAARPSGMPDADWKALKAKEDELARKERSLRTLEQNLDKKLAELTALEKRLKKMLADADVLKDAKIKHLVGVYTAMKAKSAAQVIESLDTDLAVKILAGMRGSSAGAILGLVEPKKAAKLSEALTKLQTPLEAN